MNAIAEIRPRQAPAVTFEQQCRLAESFAKSGLFGIKTPDQALALMALCEAEGLHPAIAVRDFHIIQGKPALKADAMLARFQAAGGRVKWIDMSDAKVSAEFSHPAGGMVTIDWDKQRATVAGFWGKDNWKKFPRAMLRARVISEGIRTVFPGVVVGVYTPEEVQDFDQQPPRQIQPEPEPQAEAPPELAKKLDALKVAAMRGSEMLKQSWESLSKDDRKALKKELSALKQTAEGVDYAGPPEDTAPYTEDTNHE